MTNSNEVLNIDTPENVTFDYDVAGIGSRFLAALLDTGLILIVQVAVLGTLIFVLSTVGSVEAFTELVGWALAVLGLLAFLLFWGYYIGFELLWNGQTPGKRWIGLRVIRVDGTPITASESIIRNLVRIIDLLPFAYGIGVVAMFINANSRRLGDITAGTIVVYDRRSAGLKEGSSAAFEGRVLEGDLPPGIAVEKLTQPDLEVIEEFLNRWQGLSNRHMLARHLLASILARLGLQDDPVDMSKAEYILAAMYHAAMRKKEA
jgi:uncharacterized RDD family membrane protein YckC